MAEAKTLDDYRRMTFEEAWAMAARASEHIEKFGEEIRESKRESELRMKESELRMKESELRMKESEQRMKESMQHMKEYEQHREEDEKRIKEYEKRREEDDKHREEDDKRREEDEKRREEDDKRRKESEQRGKELDRRMEKTERYINRIGKQIGGLNRSFGQLAEHLVAPGIARRFNELGYHFDAISPGGHRILGEDGKIKTEIDILLENESCIIAVEVKTKPKVQDIDHHRKQLEILRDHRNKHHDARKILGAVAGAVFGAMEKEAVLEAGMYVLEQSGDTMRIEAPSGQPSEW